MMTTSAARVASYFGYDQIIRVRTLIREGRPTMGPPGSGITTSPSQMSRPPTTKVDTQTDAEKADDIAVAGLGTSTVLLSSTAVDNKAVVTLANTNTAQTVV